MPGAPFSISRNVGSLSTLLKRDLCEAWKKCIAVKAGVELLFGAGAIQTCPPPQDTNALDLLLFWKGDIIDFLSDERERSTSS